MAYEDAESKCPVTGARTSFESPSVQSWWPEQLNLRILHQEPAVANPLGEDFDYARSSSARLDASKADLTALMTDSKTWWPADYGHYGPFFIRMAWHAAGTYRTPTVAAAARRVSSASRRSTAGPTTATSTRPAPAVADQAEVRPQDLWADLMILTGNVALEIDGVHDLRLRRRPRRRLGARGGRLLGSRERLARPTSATPATASSRDPLGAVQMGLIYVNPEGPNGNPDPMRLGRDIRETFARMAMNDEETVALIVGGHAFGKMHGAGPTT